jgi:hypothetical protein
VPQDVKEEYELIWSYFGQGFDFVLEQVNRRLKRCVTRGSFQEYYLASVLHDQSVTYRDILFKELGITDPFQLGEYIEPLEKQSATIKAFEEWLVTNRVCRYDPKRTAMKILDGTNDLHDDASMVNMISKGRNDLERYATEYKQYRADPASFKMPDFPDSLAMNNAEGISDLKPFDGSFDNFDPIDPTDDATPVNL